MPKFGIDTGISFTECEDPMVISHELDELLEEKFKAESVSSGLGFGFRDMQFEFLALSEAEEVLKFIEDFFKLKGLTLQEDGGESYVSGPYEVEE